MDNEYLTIFKHDTFRAFEVNEEKMLPKLTMMLLLMTFPIIFADQIVFVYRFHFNFGLQNHVSLSPKETRGIFYYTISDRQSSSHV